jgi:CHASE2 domain-containing sensor protein
MCCPTLIEILENQNRKIITVLVAIFLIACSVTLFLTLGYLNNDNTLIAIGYIILSIGSLGIILVVGYDLYGRSYTAI